MGSIGTFGLPASALLDNFSIANYSIPLANTEYTIVFPAGAKNFTFQSREGALIQVGKTPGSSGTLYFTIFPQNSYDITSITGSATITWYVQSPKPLQTLEVLYWT